MKRSNRTWMIDIDYYLAQQIHPLVSRLCAPIQGTNPAHLVNCLGLDLSKFQPKTSEVTISGSSPSLLSAMDTDDRLCCSKCQEEGKVRGRMTCAMIANQVKTQAKKFISTYYKGVMTCDDETCNYTTRSLNLRVIGDSTGGIICPNYPQSDGHIVRKYTEADLHRQFAYFCHILDAVRFVEKLELEVRIPLQKELARIQPMVDLAASSVQKLRNRCAYGWVQIESLCI
ncbi:DNA polymerase alpha catalytic subunit-like [Papaver somniferum]|uniref:DNA polymerase alpha catalytic subunit-like n=1 Tax=Papaver somniferum TaxID=3469 RepID=UPI000E6FB86C|nr:DNA polymerase alpha catalytic subunit-like [Papaver somniferum]